MDSFPHTSSASTGTWAYHPLELVVRPSGPASDLASRIATGLAAHHRVGFVRHGAAVVVSTAPETGVGVEGGPVAGMALNGRESRFAASGHLDLPLQRILLSDTDLVVVEGCLDSSGPTILELGPDGTGLREALGSGAKHLVALVGPHRPLDKPPPGGIPWFSPDDLAGLIEHLRDHLDAVLRARPVWAILLGGDSSTPTGIPETVHILASRCERVFVDPAILPVSAGAEPLASHHPRLGELGQILTGLESFPGVAFLVARPDGRPGLDARIHPLLQRRNAYRTATAFRAPDTHLPAVAPAIWEPKARARIHLALAGDIRCPQRILTHSPVELLDPFDSGIPADPLPRFD